MTLADYMGRSDGVLLTALAIFVVVVAVVVWKEWK